MALPSWRVIYLVGVGLLAGVVSAWEPARADDLRRGYHELGRLRAGLAFKAREEEHDSLKAALLYFQAAQAFQRAGESEYHKALLAGVLEA